MGAISKQDLINRINDMMADCKKDLEKARVDNTKSEISHIKGEIYAYRNMKYLVKHNLI